MSAASECVSEREQRFHEVAALYLEAREAGRSDELSALLARHPDVADEIAAFVAGQDEMAHAAAPLRGAVAAAILPEQARLPGPLGDFRIIREVGRGGMGIVYEAAQVSLGRRVALKVLPFAATMDSRQLQRFHNEARAAAGLHHTNIVPVFAVGCDHGVHYYAMQFIEGHTLAEFIAQQRQGPPSQAPTMAEVDAATTVPPAAQATSGAPRDKAYFRRVAEWGIQAAEALDYGHSLGVVHRDVKPANLLVDSSGRLWVTDFGLAQVQSDARLTMTGDLVGTLRYMSPEQALAKRVVVDHRTDVYSLGATLYELFALQPAFDGADRQELLRQIAFEEPRAPRRLNRAIPPELETIVLKALEKNPADRYAAAKELADDLRHWLEDRPIRAQRPSLGQRARKWARRHRGAAVATVVCLVAAVVALAISTGVIWYQKRQTEAARGEAEVQRREAIDSLNDAHAAVDQLISRAGGPELAETPNMEPLRRALLTDALHLYQNFLKRENAGPDLRLAAARAYIGAGGIQEQLGDLGPAEENTQQGMALVLELSAREPARREFQDVLAAGWCNLGVIQRRTSRPGEAEEASKTARKIATGLVKDEPNSAAFQERLARACNNLGAIYADSNRQQQAEECFLEAVHWGEQLLQAFPDDLKYQGMLVKAQANLSTLYGQRGRDDEAEKLLRQAVALQEKVVGRTRAPSQRARLAQFYLSLGEHQMKRGPYPEAFETFKKALDLRYKLNVEFAAVSDYAHEYAKALELVGWNAMLHGHDRAALELLSNADDLYGRLAQAYPKREDYRRDLAECSGRRGWLLAASYDPKVRSPLGAIGPAKRAVDLAPDNGNYWATLGMAHYRAGQWDVALAALEEAGKRPQPDGRIDLFFLAMTQWKLGRQDDARKRYGEAEAWRRQHAPSIAPLAQIGSEAAELLGIRQHAIEQKEKPPDQ
jgi:serine/threonine protein kinase